MLHSNSAPQRTTRCHSRDIRAGISNRQVDPVRIAGDIVRFVTSTTAESQCDVNRMLLLDLIGIMASCQPDDMDVVSLMFSTLYSIGSLHTRYQKGRAEQNKIIYLAKSKNMTLSRMTDQNDRSKFYEVIIHRMRVALFRVIIVLSNKYHVQNINTC